MKDQLAEEPNHRLFCELVRLETRMAYMTTPILFARLSDLCLQLEDEWNFADFVDSLRALYAEHVEHLDTGARAGAGAGADRSSKSSPSRADTPLGAQLYAPRAQIACFLRIDPPRASTGTRSIFDASCF